MSIIIDQLRISDDSKRMYINLHVNKAEYFDNIYLDSITIMTADKVSETNPNEPTEDYIYKKVFDDGVREADLVLQPTDFNENFMKSDFSRDLFFVFIKIKGVPDECTPCRLDEEITLAVTFDENMLHQKVMGFTKALADECKTPVGFSDFILLWNAFKASVETEHYIPAIKYWKMLFEDGASFGITTKPCGCHG